MMLLNFKTNKKTFFVKAWCIFMFTMFGDIHAATIVGPAIYENTEIREAIMHTGSLELKNVHVHGDIITTGVLLASYTNFFKNVSVQGNAVFNNCTVSESITINGALNSISSSFKMIVKINGFLKSVQTNFLDTITVNSHNVVLENTVLRRGITFLKREASRDQVLNLISTEIYGDINFVTPGGIVKIDSKSIIHGAIINGVVHGK